MLSLALVKVFQHLGIADSVIVLKMKPTVVSGTLSSDYGTNLLTMWQYSWPKIPIMTG